MSIYGVYGFEASLAPSVFEHLDADGDGYITAEDLERIQRQFDRGIDRDAPGNRLFGPALRGLPKGALPGKA